MKIPSKTKKTNVCAALAALAVLTAITLARTTKSDAQTTATPPPPPPSSISSPLRKGDTDASLTVLKTRLRALGYLQKHHDTDTTGAHSPAFDDALEEAINLYQRSFKLAVTGALDAATLDSLRAPRCGREDVRDGVALMLLPRTRPPAQATRPALDAQTWNLIAQGGRLWRSTRNVSYAFGRLGGVESSAVVTRAEIRAAVASAFETWARVVPLNFWETPDFASALIKIEFVAGDHGDGSPFDGRLGILSHAFPPEDGRFHLDSAELWTSSATHLLGDGSDGGGDGSLQFAIDVETVALHEIGHLIGLDHSNVRGSVMFPSIESRSIKRLLSPDDILGATALYGPRSVPLSAPSASGVSASAVAGFDGLVIVFLCFVFGEPIVEFKYF